MDIKTALYSLGVRDDSLSAGEKRSLDEDGYLPLPGILPPAQVQALRNRLQELEDEEGEDAGKEVHQEDGTDRLANLANKDPLFDQVWANPKVLAAMAHVLDGDLKLSSLNARAALPGHGLQALHCDGSHSSADLCAGIERRPPALQCLQFNLAAERLHARKRRHSACSWLTPLWRGSWRWYGGSESAPP